MHYTDKANDHTVARPFMSLLLRRRLETRNSSIVKRLIKKIRKESYPGGGPANPGGGAKPIAGGKPGGRKPGGGPGIPGGANGIGGRAIAGAPTVEKVTRVSKQIEIFQ